MKDKLIQIHWNDITFFKGSYCRKELNDLVLQEIETTGYLIEETKKHFVIALSVETTEPKRIIDLLKIPKANIISKRFLK